MGIHYSHFSGIFIRISCLSHGANKAPVMGPNPGWAIQFILFPGQPFSTEHEGGRFRKYRWVSTKPLPVWEKILQIPILVEVLYLHIKKSAFSVWITKIYKLFYVVNYSLHNRLDLDIEIFSGEGNSWILWWIPSFLC